MEPLIKLDNANCQFEIYNLRDNLFVKSVEFMDPDADVCNLTIRFEYFDSYFNRYFELLHIACSEFVGKKFFINKHITSKPDYNNIGVQITSDAEFKVLVEVAVGDAA